MIQDEIKAALRGETVWDRGEKGSVKGLHLRVAASGTRAFYFYYRTRTGTQRRPKLGDLGQLTLAEARSAARKLSLEVAAGKDPKGAWDAVKAELTVEGLYEQALKDYWDKPRFRESGRLRNVKNHWAKDLKKTFGSRKLSDVTTLEVRAWHLRFAETAPYSGNRALEILSKIFNYAIELGLRPKGSNPCSDVKAHAEKRRTRYASEAELQAISPILDREAVKFPRAAAFLYLILYTGSRPRAIERATHDQLRRLEQDGQVYGILTFDGKETEETGDQEVLVIPPQAMALIDKLPRRLDNRIVGCRMPQKLWEKVRLKAGCPDLWARDFRRTFATVGYSDGVHKDVVGTLLNHRSQDTTAIYAKLALGSRVEAARQIADKMDAILSPPPKPAGSERPAASASQ